MSSLGLEIRYRVLSSVAWLVIQFLGRTSRFRVKGLERVREMMRLGQGLVLILWHGRTMMPVFYCRNMGIQAIISLSRDGELQARIFKRFGFRTIRGSSGRGGMKAALAAIKSLQAGGSLAITPDGPRGPACEIQDGTIFMAKKAGVPVVPVGVGISPRKLMPTWDSYALPMPFGRCGLVFGAPISIPDEGDDGQVREMLRETLNAVQREAQDLVGEERAG